MRNLRKAVASSVVVASLMGVSSVASAGLCGDVSYATFTAAVDTAYSETVQYGFGLPMWATLMNQTGKVCYVYSVKGSADAPKPNRGLAAGNNAWLGSRVISAQKANTANAFSLNGLAISTGALSVAVYPGGSLYGLQHSNPVDATVAYAGNKGDYGRINDPMVGTTPGGVNVFGGGLALYNSAGVKVGAVGASGDTSCRDHTLAYRLRIALALHHKPNDDGLELVDPPVALFQQPSCGVNDPTGRVDNSGPNDFGIR